MSERFPRLTASEVEKVLGRSGFGACTKPSTPRGLGNKKVRSWAWARVLKITRCFLGPPLIRAFCRKPDRRTAGAWRVTKCRADTQKQVWHGTRIASPGSQREEGLQGMEPTRRIFSIRSLTNSLTSVDYLAQGYPLHLATRLPIALSE